MKMDESGRSSDWQQMNMKMFTWTPRFYDHLDGVNTAKSPMVVGYFRIVAYTGRLQVYQKVGKSVISVCKKAQTVLLVHFMALKESWRLSGFVMHS